MEDFSIINEEGQRLLKEVDTSKLASFFAEYRKQIIKSEEFQSPEEIRQYFRDLIEQTIAPEEAKQRAVNQINSYLIGYTILDAILSEVNPNLTEDRPPIYDILGIPSSELEIRGALPKIYANLLLQSPEIPGLFLTGHTEEEKIRTLQAYVANTIHPLGMNDNYYHGDYSWESSNSVYNVSQDTHGDVYFSRHHKVNNEMQQELFSLPSIVGIDGRACESLNIYQYTDNLISVLCLYVLQTGYVPEEFKNWKQIMKHITPSIPNASVSNGINDKPKHIAVMGGWKVGIEILSTDGKYTYIGTEIHSNPLYENNFVTTAFQGDSLVFIKKSPHGEIEFSFQGDDKKIRFDKTFELTKRDIGPALVALLHLPGRSFRDNIKILSAFDWAKNNGYMSI